MRDLRDHAANCGRIRTLNHLIKPGKTQPFDHQLVLHRGTDLRANIFQFQRGAARGILLRRHQSSSAALPEPYPTTAAEGSPTTTSAANERFLPPLTTLVTRLMATTWSFSWYAPASSFFTTVGICSSSQFQLLATSC